MAVQTLLNIVQDTCYQINEPAPSSLFGSTDTNALQWLHLLYATGRHIRSKYDYPTLKRKYRFSTVVNQKEYPLPGDFWRLTLDTAWDETNSWALFGPDDDGGIVGRDLGVVPYGTQYSFRVAGAPFQSVSETSFDTNQGYFEVSPTPGDVRALYIEYISNNWFYPKQWLASTAYSSGDFVSANGFIYKATSTGTSNSTRPSGESTTTGETGVSFQLWRGEYSKTTADTDYPIIDPETLIQGLKVRWLDSKGLDSTKQEAIFQEALVSAMNRFQGLVTINGDGPILYEFPNMSEGFVSTGW